VPGSGGFIVPLIRLAIDLAQQPFDVGLRKVKGSEYADEGIGVVLQRRVRLLRGAAELALQKDDELSTLRRQVRGHPKHKPRLFLRQPTQSYSGSRHHLAPLRAVRIVPSRCFGNCRTVAPIAGLHE
jgi:hypothetical protein